ncbi:MAG: NrfD/PsrC family molybdoenzyme membrane anchor subunit [Dehalococcoidia bacterium]|nr:NrfD/PsrC family molybdoenzyme membrane anchor subunit [Dehalococcoidia bacterium]
MTTRQIPARGPFLPWFKDQLFMGKTFGDYLRSLLTPFNLIAAVILAVGIPVAVARFAQGLAATTNLTDINPWGLWIGFDVMSGVALAAGGYVVGAAVYIFGMRQYGPIVRPAILTGFLGYTFVVIGLLFDLGRPWRLPFPIFVTVGGVASVLFLVAWHVLLYLTCQFVEFAPALFEWLGLKRIRQLAVKLTIGATVLGVVLSTLHQSALGALFLLMPGKVHPLWYSPLLPLFFFVTSIIAGLSMVIVESMLSHRVFNGQSGPEHTRRLEGLTLGLGKAGAIVLFVYFWLKIIGVMHGDNWSLLNTNLGYWFLVEILGFVLLPCFLFLWAANKRNATAVRLTAMLTVIGVVINRLNVSIISFNWNAPERYVPKWTEIAITLAIVTVGLLAFRWIVNRMPILYEHPDYPAEH